MDMGQEKHRIDFYKGMNISDGPGVTGISEVGRFMVNEEGKYVNKCWSNDDKRIIPLPKGDDIINNPINLNEGFDKTKYEENIVNGSVLERDMKMYHALLEWIYIKAYDLAANKISVIANAPALYDILQAPYERKNPDGARSDCTIYISKFNGVLYMFRFYEPSSEANEDFRLVKYRGKRFRKVMVSNGISGDSNDNEKVKRRVINKASFRGCNMLYTSKVSAIDSKGRFVSLHVMPEDNTEKLSFYRKLLRHWSIAIMTPAPKLLLGLRQRHENENDPNSEVLITGFKAIMTETVPDMVKQSTVEGKRVPWEPRICFKNLESVIDTLMAVIEDDPKVVWKMESGPSNEYGFVDHLVIEKLPDSETVELIPEWYYE